MQHAGMKSGFVIDRTLVGQFGKLQRCGRIVDQDSRFAQFPIDAIAHPLDIVEPGDIGPAGKGTNADGPQLITEGFGPGLAGEVADGHVSPQRAKALAMARPKSPAAPVITQTRPARSMGIMSIRLHKPSGD